MVESDDPIGVLGPALAAAAGTRFQLESVAARGTRIWPGEAVGDSVRWFTGRYLAAGAGEPSEADLLALLGRVAERYRWTHIERLQLFGGEPAFTKAQGE
jgi:isocitrate dehydrogenase